MVSQCKRLLTVGRQMEENREEKKSNGYLVAHADNILKTMMNTYIKRKQSEDGSWLKLNRPKKQKRYAMSLRYNTILLCKRRNI